MGTAIGEECAAQGGRQRKFTRIVMVRVQVRSCCVKQLASKFSRMENLSHVGMRVSTYKLRAA